MSAMKDVLKEMNESKKQAEDLGIDLSKSEILSRVATWALFVKTYGDDFLTEECRKERMQLAMVQGEPVDYIPEDRIIIMRTYDPGTETDMRLIELKIDADDANFIMSAFVRVPEETGLDTRYVLTINDDKDEYMLLVDLDENLTYLHSYVSKGKIIFDADNQMVKHHVENIDWRKHLERYRRAKDRVFM